MEDTKPIQFAPAGSRSAGAAHAPAARPPDPKVTFDRKELNLILAVYGRRVSAGDWRDYALDFLKDAAVFSIFRRSSEMPLYRVEKRPRLARKQGAFCVISATGLILKRGHDLAQVLKVLEKKKLQIID